MTTTHTHTDPPARIPIGDPTTDPTDHPVWNIPTDLRQAIDLMRLQAWEWVRSAHRLGQLARTEHATDAVAALEIAPHLAERLTAQSTDTLIGAAYGLGVAAESLTLMLDAITKQLDADDHAEAVYHGAAE